MQAELHVVVTARPSWARVKSLVDSFIAWNGISSLRVLLVGPAVSDRYGDLRSQLHENYQVEFFSALHESDDLPSIALSAIDGASALTRYWTINRPKMVLIIADRTETLGVAMAASLMQIPLAHLQGGEVSGSIDDKIRNANSKLADYHLTTNRASLENLKKLGEKENRIEIVGCPSIDLVQQALVKHSNLVGMALSASSFGGVGDDFSLKNNFGLIMFHPDTKNVNENFDWMNYIIEVTSDLGDLVPNWLWFWPNPDHGSRDIAAFIRRKRERSELKGIRFLINLTPESFLSLAVNARAILGNSSFGIREASYLGLPALNLGLRQDSRERGLNVIDIPQIPSNLDSTHEFRKMIQKNRLPVCDIYGDGRAGEKAALAITRWMKDPLIK